MRLFGDKMYGKPTGYNLFETMLIVHWTPPVLIVAKFGMAALVAGIAKYLRTVSAN